MSYDTQGDFSPEREAEGVERERNGVGVDGAESGTRGGKAVWLYV